jgi:hypothetical protein
MNVSRTRKRCTNGCTTCPLMSPCVRSGFPDSCPIILHPSDGVTQRHNHIQIHLPPIRLDTERSQFFFETCDYMQRTKPALWETSKKMACTRGGLCNHSARKMQWAVNYYKRNGGGYRTSKSPQNSLVRWTRQRWRTSSGKKSNGVRRYLPDKAWKHLSPSEIRRTNATKARGYSKGKQWVKQPRDVVEKVRRYR